MIKVAQIDPNGLCNSKCWFCPVAYSPNPAIARKNMPINDIESILKQLHAGIGDFVDPDYTFFWPSHFNEILLYPHFEEMVQLYQRYNFKLIIFSNGVNLTPEQVDTINKYTDTIQHITLNIPSAFQDQWSEYTGFNKNIFTKLINNLEYVNTNLSSDISWAIQVNNFNEDSLVSNGGTVEIMENAPQINLDRDHGDLMNTINKFKEMFSRANVYPDNNNVDRAGYLKKLAIFSNEQYLNRVSDNGTKKVVGCSERRAEEFLHINANGDVFLCCCDYDFDTVFGNIYQDSIRDIWNSVERKNMISKSFSNFCTNCALAIWE